MCCTKRTAATRERLSRKRTPECQQVDTPKRRLAAGGFSPDGVRPGACGDNRLGFRQFFLVALLPNEKPDARRNLLDAVTDGQTEGFSFKDHLLEVG
jgi:hypothetical protein